jgi:gamma-glutamyltranspeptidase / glutathione hydrolase
MRRLLVIAVALLAMLAWKMSLDAQNSSDHLDRSSARSMVITQQGIVAASQTLASQAGAQVLARGGSAVDAAIAANAVLGVVEPMMDGMGGDLFAIEWDSKTGKLTGLNSSGWAPEHLTIDLLKQKGHTRMPGEGIFSVTVPGCVAGWWALHQKFGRLPWKDLLQPAIYYASHGYPVTELTGAYWQSDARQMTDPSERRVFLPGGKPPAVGEVFRNPDYAAALKRVAEGGRDAFYRGPIAHDILAASERLGGVMAAVDLSDFQPEWVTPISTTYRGWTVYELPPNGQGMAALEMLNIFERFPLERYAPLSVDALHVKLEAQKRAYADLFRYNGDPRFAKVPVAGLISKSYAAERAKTIDPEHAHCDDQPGQPPQLGNDTVYLTAVDRNGNIVSMIQSISGLWGSGVVVDGFPLQNRGAGFVLDPSHPDALAPRKRPFHTIIPAFMERGSIHMGFGIMGGLNQPQAHAQFVSYVADHGRNIQEALEMPRFTKLNRGGCDFLIEDRVPAEVREALVKKGHVFQVRGDYASPMGGGEAVIHDSATGVNYGASSPRKDGAAIPEPGPYFSSESQKK